MTVHEKLERLVNTTDKHGKRLYYEKEPDQGRVWLEIDGEKRCLGYVIAGKENLIYTKVDDESEIFQKTNSWSINYTVLSVVDHIHIETRIYDYAITRERAEEFGEFFHFKDTTELKLYIPLKYWDKRHRGLRSANPTEYKRRNLLGDSWYEKMQITLGSELMKEIGAYVNQARKTTIVYPETDKVFRAFRLCSFEHTKVVILGQDPYNDGSADGLAFSFNTGERYQAGITKSLDVIFSEIERDLYNGMKLDYDYDLVRWARQGVLLLNTVLTVEKKKPLSHAGIGWERFTKIALKNLLLDPEPKVFLAWGNKAKEHIGDVITKIWGTEYGNQLNSKSLDRFEFYTHLILTAKHPAADLYNRDITGVVKVEYPTSFSGCKHFSKANNFLTSNNRKPIKW